jgi:hypothetical protein
MAVINNTKTNNSVTRNIIDDTINSPNNTIHLNPYIGLIINRVITILKME